MMHFIKRNSFIKDIIFVMGLMVEVFSGMELIVFHLPKPSQSNGVGMIFLIILLPKLRHIQSVSLSELSVTRQAFWASKSIQALPLVASRFPNQTGCPIL